MNIIDKRYQYLKDWRKRNKKRMVEAFGSCCGICKYDKCKDALEFHHINPNEKDFTISKNNVNNWNKLVEELKKCICVCSNCHKEIHNGITKIPNDIRKFDESFTNYKTEKIINYIKCPICKSKMPDTQQFCSMKCFYKNNEGKYWKIDWNKYDLSEMILKNNFTEISKIIGVSVGAVIKRLKKLNLYKK